MWRLAKADFIYNRTLFISIYAVILTAAAVNAVIGGMENLLMVMMFFSIVAIGAETGNEEAKYHMKRLLIRLPVPLRRIALAGHIVWILYCDFTGKAGRFLLRLSAGLFACLSGAAYLFIVRFPNDLDKTVVVIFLKSIPGTLLLLGLAAAAAFLYFFQFLHRRSYTN